MKPARSAARTIYLFKRIEMLIKSELEKELQDIGVTPGQYTTMSLLGSQKEVSSAEMARRMGVSAQSMSETITLLERKGWITRQEKLDNRRILQIALTNEGTQMLGHCERRAERVETAMLACIAPDEIIRLRGWLVKMLDGAKE